MGRKNRKIGKRRKEIPPVTESQVPVHVDKDRILAQIKAQSIEPFQEFFAEYLHPESRPSRESIKKLSADRYWQGAVMGAQLTGYKKDRPLVNNMWVMIQSMSDSELRNRLVELERELTQSRSLPETIEHED